MNNGITTGRTVGTANLVITHQKGLEDVDRGKV